MAKLIKTARRLCLETCTMLIDKTILLCIGQHTTNFAMVQNTIAQTLK